VLTITYEVLPENTFKICLGTMESSPYPRANKAAPCPQQN
jgi:hypothetical protein